MVMFNHSRNNTSILCSWSVLSLQSWEQKKAKGACKGGKSLCKIGTYFLTKKWKSKRCVTEFCNQTLHHKFPPEQDSRLEVTGSISMWCGTNFKFQFFFFPLLRNEKWNLFLAKTALGDKHLFFLELWLLLLPCLHSLWRTHLSLLPSVSANNSGEHSWYVFLFSNDYT